MLASTQISVAKPYGRFGQKLESLQGRSGPGTGQGNTVQDRSSGHGRGTDQKRQSKSRSERGQKAGQGMMGIVKYK